MRLRQKIFVSLGVALGSYIAIAAAVQFVAIYPSFEELEAIEASDDGHRCREALVQAVDHLRAKATPYATSDLLHEWIGDGPNREASTPFPISSLGQDLVLDRIDLFVVVDLSGRVLFRRASEIRGRPPIHSPELPDSAFPKSHPLIFRDHKSGFELHRSGLLSTPNGPVIICSRPILKSSGLGPARGTLLAAIALGPEDLDALRKQTRTNFDLVASDSAKHDAEFEKARESLGPESAEHVVLLAGTRRVYSHVDDYRGRPTLFLRVDHSREITSEGWSTLRYSLLVLAGGAATMFALVAHLMQRHVIGPLTALTTSATQVGHTHETGSKADSLPSQERRDEIGMMAREMQAMVGRIEESRAMLLAASRQAGMADMARNLLHNLGNVLNSANVSANLIGDTVRKSRSQGLERVVKLLRAHESDVSGFLGSAGQGEKFANYLTQLASAVKGEREQVISELDSLVQSISHMNEIIRAQNSLTTSEVAVQESMEPSEVMDQSIMLISAAMRRHGIRVERHYTETPPIYVDRAKLQQILVNLLANAKDAVGANSASDRRITVSIRLLKDDRVSIGITDNGIGIPKDNLARIFAQGFTTKIDGHGFGLHYSAVAVSEMGGSLQADSEGPGKGSTFTLLLPVQPVREEVPA